MTEAENTRLRLYNKMECNGECKKHDECAGEIKEVIVFGAFCPTGMNFTYCKTAREEDERRGFTVEIVDEHGLTPKSENLATPQEFEQLLRDKHDTIVRNTVQLQTASDNINRLQAERDEMVQQVMNAWEILVDIDHPKMAQVFTALGFNPDGSICKPLNI